MSTDPSLSNLLAGVSSLVGRRDLLLQQESDWLTGSATGGPNSDGNYPIDDSTGTTHLMEAPAKLRSTNKGLPSGLSRDTSAILAEIEIAISDYALGDYSTATANGTDLTPLIIEAVAYIGVRGGRIFVPRGFVGYLGTSLSLPKNIKIVCREGSLGTHQPTDEPNVGAILYLNPAATITLNSSAGLIGFSLWRAGLTMGQTSAQVATWTGTAITLAANAADCAVQRMQIFGFAQACISSSVTNTDGAIQNNRLRFEDNAIDCLAGLRLHNSYDISRIRNNQLYPYTTVASAAEVDGAQLKRPGTALWFSGVNDWSHTRGNFSYGYMVGERYTDCASVNSIGNGHDHVPGSADGSIGYLIEGNCREIGVTAGRTAGKDYGYRIAGTYGTARICVTLSNCYAWVCQTAAIHAVSGDYQIRGGSFRNIAGVGSGLLTTATSGAGDVDADFRGFATAINNYSSTTVTRVRPICTFGQSNAVLIVNSYQPVIASAASIVPNGDDWDYVLTGTINIGYISSPNRALGRGVTLTLDILDGVTFLAGGNIIPKTGADTAYAAGSQARFKVSGGNWREL